MTYPDFRPVDPEPGSVTEPVAQPPFPPAQPPVPPVPAASAPVPGVAPAPQLAPAFMPVAPEPAHAAQPAAISKGGPKGTSNVLTVALVGALLLGAVGVSFAAGRASSSPESATTGSGVSNGDDNGVTDGNGQGGPLTRRGPGASFDLNGNGDGGFEGDPDHGVGFDRGFGRGVGPGGLTGTVTAVDADSITVSLANGQTVTFGLDGSTTYHQQVAASASDVKAGSTVQVELGEGVRPDQVTRGDDGSITLGTAGDVTVVP